MQSAWHNCPTINGVMQAAGRRHEATAVTASSTGSRAEFRLNVERAYPAEAGVKSWTRSIVLDRARDAVELADRWSLERPALLEFSFITNEQVSAGPGSVILGGRARILHDPVFEAVVEIKAVEDSRLLAVWGKQIHRVKLIRRDGPADGQATFRIERT
jgi:hypothetical protein